MKVIERIVSGACIGADMAGLYAAKDLGFPTGGWNWNHDNRNKELRAEFGIKPAKESTQLQTNNRTLLNAVLSDCTIHFKHSGEYVTQPYLIDWHKPWYEVEMEDYSIPDWMEPGVIKDLRLWLKLLSHILRKPLIVNIAGNADTRMEPLVREFLCVALEPFCEYEDQPA